MRRTGKVPDGSLQSVVRAGSHPDGDDAPLCLLAWGSKDFSIRTGLRVYNVFSVIGKLAVSRRSAKHSKPTWAIREA